MLNSFRALLKRGDPEPIGYDIDRGLENYQTVLYAAIYAYLNGERTLESAKSEVEDASAAAFVIAFYAGFAEAGANPSNDDRKWLVERYALELAYIEKLFVTLREKKEIERDVIALLVLALYHATGYVQTMMGIFNISILRGAPNEVLTFGGPDGLESCGTCQTLKGVTRPASWWVQNNLIPGPPGNSNYECYGVHCQHRLFDAAGRQFIR